MIDYTNYAGGLHWSELEGPTDTVLIVVQDWCIILDCQIQKHPMNTEYWSMHVQTAQMILRNQKCSQLGAIR